MTTAMEKSCVSTPATNMMPRDSSGDFLSQNTHRVSDLQSARRWRTLYENDTTKITQRSVTTEDGRRYLVSSSELKHQSNDTVAQSYLETTAWLTKPDGMYTRRLINLGRLGIAGTVISAPQNIGKITSIEQNAHNVLSIGQHEAQRKHQDPRFFILAGESRGSMIGIGEARFAEEHNMTPLFAHLDAPCIPRGLVEAIEEEGPLVFGRSIGPQAIRAVGQEIMTLHKAIDNDRKANRHMGKTLDISLRSPVIHAQEGLALLTGDAGVHARNAPKSLFGHNGLAADDALSNPLMWKEIFGDFEGMTTIVETDGGHLSTIGRVFHEGWLRNMTCFRDVAVGHPEFTSPDAHEDPLATVVEFSQYYAHANPLYTPLDYNSLHAA